MSRGISGARICREAGTESYGIYGYENKIPFVPGYQKSCPSFPADQLRCAEVFLILIIKPAAYRHPLSRSSRGEVVIGNLEERTVFRCCRRRCHQHRKPHPSSLFDPPLKLRWQCSHSCFSFSGMQAVCLCQLTSTASIYNILFCSGALRISPRFPPR